MREAKELGGLTAGEFWDAVVDRLNELTDRLDRVCDVIESREGGKRPDLRLVTTEDDDG